jgi:hypothetical protein
MTDTEPSSARTWQYRFFRPGDIEIETQDLKDDAAAEAHARDLSKSQVTPVIVQRHNMVSWEYVNEVDERP